MSRLSGGAIQENWKLLLIFEGSSEVVVLRTTAPASISASHGLDREFALLSLAHRNGVKVPRPILECRSTEVIGRPFFLTSFVEGTAAGRHIAKMVRAGQLGSNLAYEVGAELARIHAIPPDEFASLVGEAPSEPTRDLLDSLRRQLDEIGAVQPILEWAIQWCLLNRPASAGSMVPLHRDFRTGNYLVHDGHLAAVLDWEFSGWGDPREDIGWLTAGCWRFGNDHKVVGGMGDLTEFTQGYRSITPTLTFQAEDLRYWQIVAHARWAVIALQQAARVTLGGEPSLELALTGRMVSQLEADLLVFLEPA